MERKLKTFKSLKRRENILSKFSQFFLEIVSKSKVEKKNIDTNNLSTLSDNLSASRGLNQESEDSISSLAPSEASISLSISNIPFLTTLKYLLYIVLWIIIYLVAVQLEFGFVYFILSSLFFIYFNTRTGPKEKGEISAYSVFNSDCRAIEGTLKAEQLEREFNLILHK